MLVTMPTAIKLELLRPKQRQTLKACLTKEKVQQLKQSANLKEPCGALFLDILASAPPGRPRPLKIITSQMARNVQNLAYKI